MKKKVLMVLAVVLVAALACGLLAGCADPRTDVFFGNGLMPVANKDGFVGYVDEDGNIVIDCQYAVASPFYGEYALATYNEEEYFAIDQKGKQVGDIKLSEFDWEVCEGTAIVPACDKITGLWGFFDLNTAAWAVAPIYDETTVYGGVGRVYIGNLKGAIDPVTGAELAPCEYQDCEYSIENDLLTFYTQTEEGYEVTAINTATKTVVTEKTACDNIFLAYDSYLIPYVISTEDEDGAVTDTYYIAGIEYSVQYQNASGTGSEFNFNDNNIFGNVFMVSNHVQTDSGITTTYSLVAVYGGKATVIAQDLPESAVITEVRDYTDVYAITVPGQDGEQAVTTYFDGKTGAIITLPVDENGDVVGEVARADDTVALYCVTKTEMYSITSVAEDGSVSAAQTKLFDITDMTVESVSGDHVIMVSTNTGETGVYDFSGNLVKALAPGAIGVVIDGYIVEIDDINYFDALYRLEDGKQILDFSDELIMLM